MMRLLLCLWVCVMGALTACSVTAPILVPERSVGSESGVSVPLSPRPGVLQWRNLAYAQAPVGPLRWAAPRPLVPSDQPVPSQPFPLMCPQMASTTGGTEGEGVFGREDCLYLDVTAPESSTTPLPVMFWIHGGGNTSGHKDSYDFSALVEREQVVVVAINYRLGPLGWFDHPTLSAGASGLDQSSNFGTLDTIAALSWVQRNIERFGGDPDNVTIFGESAGGRNVLSLLVSPLSEGLFHRAIAQSGHVRSLSRDAAFNERDQYTHVDRGSWAVLESLGLNGSDVEASELRAIDMSQFVGAYYALPVDHMQPAIIADDIVIPAAGLSAALADPQYAKNVPVMAGTTRDEITLWIGLNRYFVDADYPLTRLLPPRMTIRDEALYRFWTQIRSRGWREQGVDGPLAALESAGYDTLFAYRFDWNEQDDNFFIAFSEILGAPHGSEIAFIQGAPMYGPIGDYMYPDTDSARVMTERMMGAWAEFARSGRPGAVANVDWPPYSAMAPHFMRLDSDDGLGLSFGAEDRVGLMNDIAQTTVLSPLQQCLLLWELLTAVGQPDYAAYSDWAGGQCQDVDAVAEKRAIRTRLEAQYGSASLP
jgi:para-nitrobenzyl esterase